MSYVYPTAVTAVSDSFADHVARRSVNPGTDYKAPYGSPVVSVAAGTVTDADGSPDGSGGRTVHVDHYDGSGADYLHLSALSVSVGDAVAQGQRIGYSGGSGEGENNYYAPHLHISFRPNHAHGYGNVGNLDFDALMRTQATSAGGGATPIPTGDEIDMATLDELRAIVAAGPVAASFLPFCIQNREKGAPPTPGLAIFANGYVEAISREQWDMFQWAGAKQYYTQQSGHFAEFIRQAALLRASYGTTQRVEIDADDLAALAQQIAASKPDLDADAIADAVADELASRIAAPTP